MRFASTSLVALACAVNLAGWQGRTANTTFRVLSWNVSGDSFVKGRAAFEAHLRIANADIILLDEVAGGLGPADLEPVLKAVGEKAAWNVSWGLRGGRQRAVIATRLPFAQVAAFQENTYPERVVQDVLNATPEAQRQRTRDSLAAGIPLNGGIIRIGGRSVLAAVADVECCGTVWQQVRRLGEAREIRRLMSESIRRYRPAAVILAGDFNLATAPAGQPGIGSMPLLILSGPYPAPFHALLAAEAYHRDGRSAWTIHGHGTAFPSLPFDFQLYSPNSLRVMAAEVINSAMMEPVDLARFALTRDASAKVSEHLPVLVEYEWAMPR